MHKYSVTQKSIFLNYSRKDYNMIEKPQEKTQTMEKKQLHNIQIDKMAQNFQLKQKGLLKGKQEYLLGQTCNDQTTLEPMLNKNKPSIKQKTEKKRKKNSHDFLSIPISIPTVNLEQQKSMNKGLIAVINYISEKIDNNETYECNYAHFHIMNCYAQAERLTIFSQNHRNSAGFGLLSASVQKLNYLSKKQPVQVQNEVCYDVIADCMNFYKHSHVQGYYRKKLKSFLEENEVVINNFMPLYFAYFRVVAQYDTVLGKNADLFEALAYLKEKEDEVRRKYHREDL